MVAIGIIYIPIFARVVRSAVLAAKGNEYVEAARALGKSDLRILFLEVLPNCLSPIIVQATVTFADAIIIEAGLSFLGLGAPPPAASWGKMLNQATSYMKTLPHMAIFPGVAISLSVLGFNLLGDGLRDVLDPRLRRSAR
jgi:ABC-type dipeptide/oligopeptide/nickel transport system permease subunit